MNIRPLPDTPRLRLDLIRAELELCARAVAKFDPRLQRTGESSWGTGKRIKTRYVVSLSSGASSAVAAQRVIDRYGRENIDLVFANTLWEDEDNWRFLKQLADRWGGVTVLTVGKTPLEVAKNRQLIPNQMHAPCTYELKIKPIQDFVKWRQSQGYKVVMCIGMNWQDKNRGRTNAPLKNWKANGCTVRFPLLWKPKEVDPLAIVRSWGIDPPHMYAQGYKHANCGGRCVKQGKRDFARTLTHYPERFEEVASWERTQRLDPRFAEYSIVRDWIDKKEFRPMALDELRQEIEGKNQDQLKLWDFAADLEGGCATECGVSGDWDRQPAPGGGERVSGGVEELFKGEAHDTILRNAKGDF